MHINHANLSALFVAFNTAFQGGLNSVGTPDYGDITTTVPSTTKTNEYGWMGAIPRLREWLGDRVVHGIKSHGYSIKNRSFELTVGVDRDDIDDDNLGIYNPLMTELGASAATHPDELVFGMLGNAYQELCYDGQYFFDTDHPVLDVDGQATTQSNLENNSGSGTRWYLLDCSRTLKPLIYQTRKEPTFVAKTAETDDNVFHAKEYIYGVDARRNVGFGLWQQAYCSRTTLDAAGLQAAITALEGRTGDYGKPLGMRATHLVVPSSLRWKAVELLSPQRNAAGADNVMKDVVKLIVPRWLA